MLRLLKVKRYNTKLVSLYKLWDEQADADWTEACTSIFFTALHEVDKFFGVEFDTNEEYLDFAERNGLRFDEYGRLRQSNPVVCL